MEKEGLNHCVTGLPGIFDEMNYVKKTTSSFKSDVAGS